MMRLTFWGYIVFWKHHIIPMMMSKESKLIFLSQVFLSVRRPLTNLCSMLEINVW